MSAGDNKPAHEPVMAAEVVGWLRPPVAGTTLDCTVGGGGHARALLQAGAGRVLGIDRDAEALPVAAAALARWRDRVELVHADFRDVEALLDRRGIATVAGAVADLGLSSLQLDDPVRGFSFRRAAPLDMRMDRSAGPTAAELLRAVPEARLAEVIRDYGEDRHARRIARRIVARRAERPIVATDELAAVVRGAVPGRGRVRIDPATRTFQALRIWVNRELERLDHFLRAVCGRLASGARFVVLSFHSLEDRIVKTVFRELARARPPVIELLTRRPVRPQEAEIARNPRARSARLRAVACVP